MANTKPGPHTRLAYAALQKALAEGTDEAQPPCEVPGCLGPKVLEDSCHQHALGKPMAGALPNDGVIDWLAIEIAAEGSRRVGLTWVEWEIAAGTILANGGDETEVVRRLGGWPKKSQTRRKRIYDIADAIREECASASR